MDNIRVITRLSFPVAVSTPSPRNIQWSEDGQLFVLSRNAIHVLTPEFSANLALFSVYNSRPLRTSSEFTKDAEWITNRIELDKTIHHNWAMDTDDWSALSLGSLDVSWIGMALSPTNASKNHCCVMAALTSNLEVSLWSSLKNHISGEWQKIQDITQTIKDSISPLHHEAQRVRTAQVQCLAWSAKVHNIGSTDDSYCRSILALGNRAGSIICMGYARETGLSYLEEIQIASDWIIDMTWSSWSSHEIGYQSAFIYCSIADGSVHRIHIEVSSPLLKIKFGDTVEHLHPIDHTPTTALSLIQCQTRNPILVYTKPGVVNLQTIIHPLSSCDSVVLTLPIQPNLRKQDCFSAISGIMYYEEEDSMQMHASDGTVYKISSVTDFPKISIDDKFLGIRDRAETFKVCKEDVDIIIDERVYISTVIGTDQAVIFGWFYEYRRPNDFSYKFDSQHTSFFGLDFFPGSKKLLNEHVSSCISTVDNTFVCGSAPFRLRETLACLNHSLLTDEEIDSILGLLQENSVQTLRYIESSTYPKNSQNFLFTKLFEDSEISIVRSRLILMNSFLSLDFNRPIVPKYLNQLTRSINQYFMQVVLKKFQSMTSHQDGDKDFMLRWLNLCHISGDHLQQEAMETATAMDIQNVISQDPKICEHCPACHVLIPLDFEGEAVCENGHRWQRCSITSFILATPNVRTCVGCRRKSLLPRSLKFSSDVEDQVWLPSSSQSEFVNNLLEAIVWCIYCENRFVRLL